MTLEIDDYYGEDFIRSLPRYMLSIIKLDEHRCNNIKNEFNIDAKNIILFAIKNLSIRHVKDLYVIEVDKNKKYKGMNIEKLINTITYGNRSIKGYRVIPDLFKLIAKNIPAIYGR